MRFKWLILSTLALIALAPACDQHQNLGATADAGPSGGGGDGAPAPASSIDVLVGLPGGAGTADDRGGDARFVNPIAITGDGVSTLYVLDDCGPQTAAAIRRIDVPSGAVTTVARGSTTVAGGLSCGPLRHLWLDGTSIYFNSSDDGVGATLWAADVSTGAVTLVAGGAEPAVTTTSAGEAIEPVDGAGSAGGFIQIRGIAGDGDGHLFIADGASEDGIIGFAGIRSVDLATGTVTTVAGGPIGAVDGIGGAARFASPTGLTSDGHGDLYFAGDDGAIRELALASGAVSTVATLNTGGTGPQPYLGGIVDLAVARDGALVVLGLGQLYEVEGNLVEPLATLSTGDSDGLSPAVNAPLGLWLQGGDDTYEDWSAYVADSGNFSVRRFDRVFLNSGDELLASTVAGASAHVGGADGVAAEALLSRPAALTLAPNGDVYFIDQTPRTDTLNPPPEAGIVRVIDPTGRVTTVAAGGASLAATGARVFVGCPPSACVSGRPACGSVITMLDPAGAPTDDIELTGGTATFSDGLGMFGNVTSMAIDGDGEVDIADAGLGAVLAMSVGSAPLGSASQPSDTVVSELAGGLDAPIAIALDGHGNIYVAERTAIKRIAAAGGAATLIAGPEAGWQQITSIAYDPAGFLYVADLADHRVRAIRLATGDVLDLAGTATHVGVKVGALPGGLNEPTGLTLLPAGDLAISDHAENVIVVVHAPAAALAAPRVQ